jgi:predicted acyl esterase
MGGPVVAIGYDTTGADTQLDVRVWDVAPGGSEKGLVTRGSYRSTTPAGAGRTATVQLAPQGYRFATGHTIEVQVTANDEPYHLADKAHTDVTVHRVRLTLPLWVAPGATRPAHGGHRSPWPVIVGLALLVLAAIGAAAGSRRRHGHAADAPSDT